MKVLSQRLSAFFSDIVKHEVLNLSSSLAFTIALALSPFLILLILLLSFLGDSYSFQLINQVEILAGDQGKDIVAILIESAKKHSEFNSFSGIISFVIICISGSAIFSQLRYALDKIQEKPPDKKPFNLVVYLKDLFSLIVLLIGFIFLVVTSLAVSSFLKYFLTDFDGFFWRVLVQAFSFCIFTFLFFIMFRTVPSKEMGWQRSLLSGIMAAVFFMIGKTLIGIYLGTTAVGSAYGAAGSLVVFLVWIYYSSFTFFISYEFTNNVILGE